MSAIVNEKYPESELTGKIIGCCMEVHRIPGNGFQEVIYQQALAIEFNNKTFLSAENMKWPFFIKEKTLEPGGWTFL